MKTCVSLAVVTFFTFSSIAQKLNVEIKSLTKEIAQRVIKKQRIRLAVADFVNNSGKSDPLSKYVTEQVESELLSPEFELELIDRKHLEQLLSDNELQSNGLIDERTAKSSTSFIKVDGWVFGEVTSFGEEIKITIKVIDVSTSLIFASASTELINDPAIDKLKESTKDQNQPLEEKECYQRKRGDFCFFNSYKTKVRISIDGFTNLMVNSGESQCLYDIAEGMHSFLINGYDEQSGTYGGSAPYMYGQMKVEKCKSGKYTIKL